MTARRIAVKVRTRAKRRGVTVSADGTVVVSTTAAPADGEANDDVIAILAEHFRVAKSCVRITRGHASTRKIIEILA